LVRMLKRFGNVGAKGKEIDVVSFCKAGKILLGQGVKRKENRGSCNKEKRKVRPFHA